MKSFFYKLWVIIRNIGIMLFFVALTFLLLESIKYYQNMSEEDREQAVILVDEEVFIDEDTGEEIIAIIKGVEIDEIVVQEEAVSVDVKEESVIEETIIEEVMEEIVPEPVVIIEETPAVVEVEEEHTVVEAIAVSSDAASSSQDKFVNDYFSFIEIAKTYKLPEEAIFEESSGVEEDNYSLYEEDLPQDIIVESGIHKDIKDIKVEPSHKPPYFGDKPVIAIVIDDMGVSKKRTKDINSLMFPLTSSFLTYGNDLNAQVEESLRAGHEVMAHIPMEAKGKKDVAPDVLMVSMSDHEVIDKLGRMIDKYRNIKGVNNHMGSKFTEDKSKMYDVMEVLRERGLFFLDSRTSDKSAAEEAADKYKVPYANRNVFLDNENDLNYILGQLKAVEKLAEKKGYAIAIGHPKSQTYQALKQWLPTLEDKDLKLVHLSEIVDVLNKHIENSSN
ncbi:MAG: divergent polysaccharide deacetylase family protein [Lactobacillaceae bacterium]|jgi:polysaccharide deacetylase 2 family uncharacterized protein YibQ|nr:divergent polysaccharide deacetylase family protein [Lactobacillaceae bacterium]